MGLVVCMMGMNAPKIVVSCLDDGTVRIVVEAAYVGAFELVPGVSGVSLATRMAQLQKELNELELRCFDLHLSGTRIEVERRATIWFQKLLDDGIIRPTRRVTWADNCNSDF